MKKIYVHRSEIGTLTFQLTQPRVMTDRWKVFIEEEEYIKLEKIILNKINENDELGSEFVLVSILKDEINTLKEKLLKYEQKNAKAE